VLSCCRIVSNYKLQQSNLRGKKKEDIAAFEQVYIEVSALTSVL